MRAFLVVWAMLACVGCAAQEPAEAAPTRDGELRAAWEAYSAFCGACPDASTCCLREQDFTPARYSDVSGRYLRAMREHYECRRADMLIDVSAYPDSSLRYPEDRVYTRLDGRTKLSCERAACGGSAEVMVAELDRALSEPLAHSPGALVACPNRAVADP